jgi:predicted chitinase
MSDSARTQVHGHSGWSPRLYPSPNAQPGITPDTSMGSQRFDRARFLAAFEAQFGKDRRFGAGGAQRVLGFLEKIEQDPSITDIRWAAYMMATTVWETTILVSEEHVATDRKGKVLLDKKGVPVRVRRRHWEHSMAPVDEVGHGRGRRYFEPVKIKLLDNGTVRVTEHDGDQFIVRADGSFRSLTKKGKMGATAGTAPSAVYEADDGHEQVYFGRGYVQLTWWSNYAAAGVAIGRGFDLLVDPDLVKDPKIAYEIMSIGMRTGKIFANGRKFDDYFRQGISDYKKARRMVNGNDHAEEIADIARKFEKVLKEASPTPVLPAVSVPALH